MAKLTYNLARLEKCIFSLYDDIKTPDDILKTWEIDENGIEKAWEELTVGKVLIGGSPLSRIRMIDCWKWEHIVDPPLDDDYQPLWEEAQDCKEITANNGNKAQMILTERGDFDLIVTDYQMPDGNGLELLEFCQRGQLGIPVIVFHGGSVGPEGFLSVKDCVAVVLKPNHEELKGMLLRKLVD